MPEYRNLPGGIVVKEDNNLSIIESIPGDITLIVGTAPDGPINQLYLAQDSVDAENTFDPAGTRTGTLLRGMHEAYEGGANLVAMFRIGASAEVLDHLNGWKIVSRSTNLSFTFDYSLNSGAHILRIQESITGAEVYNSLTGVNTGAVGVTFDENLVTEVDGPYTYGTPASPISLSAGDTLEVGDAVTIDTPPTASDMFHTATTPSDATQFRPGMQAVANSGGDIFLVNYVIGDKIYFSHWKEDGAGDFIVFPGMVGNETDITLIPSASFYAEVDGLSQTKTEHYEALARAYWELESANVDMVVPVGVKHDDPNIINNLGATEVPTDPLDLDFLGTVYQFEHEGQLFFQWQMDVDAEADIVPSPASMNINGIQAEKLITGTYLLDTILSAEASPSADIAFNEVNFTHQLASYLYNLSVNDNEALGVMSSRGPRNYSTSGVIQWIGKDPIYDANDLMIVSGSGLLGDKWMVGSTGHAEGFFATVNGLAGGIKLVDERTKANVDIGAYVSIVPEPVRNLGAFATSASGYITSAESLYSGMIMKLEPQTAPTNKKFSTNVSLPISLKKTFLDSLVGAKYTVFGTDFNGITKVIDAPTVSLKTSDYTRLLTVRCMMASVETVRRIAEPFYGGMYTGPIRNSLQEEVNQALFELQELGILVGGLAQVRATRAQEIKGEGTMRLTLITPGEFRRLIIFVALSNSK